MNKILIKICGSFVILFWTVVFSLLFIFVIFFQNQNNINIDKFGTIDKFTKKIYSIIDEEGFYKKQYQNILNKIDEINNYENSKLEIDLEMIKYEISKEEAIASIQRKKEKEIFKLNQIVKFIKDKYPNINR